MSSRNIIPAPSWHHKSTVKTLQADLNACQAFWNKEPAANSPAGFQPPPGQQAPPGAWGGWQSLTLLSKFPRPQLHSVAP